MADQRHDLIARLATRGEWIMSNEVAQPADAETRIERVYSRWVKRGDNSARSVLAAIREAYACGATAELTALAVAGRLVHAQLFAVERWKVDLPQGSIKGISEKDARHLAEQHGGTVSRSLVRLLTDGTEVLGPWLPVPEPTCTCPDCDVSTLTDQPERRPTVKGLDPACPIHGKLSVWCACKPGTTCGYHLANPGERSDTK
jgi:hypothetical protein